MSGAAGFAAVAGAIEDIVAGLHNRRRSDQMFEFARAQAEEQEAWRKTGYQTSVKDMIAAGLNPMLAVMGKGGGAAPGGGTPVSAAGSQSQGATGALGHSAVAIAQVDALRAQTEKTRAEEAEIRARTPTHAVHIDKMKQDIDESVTRIGKLIADTGLSEASAAHQRQQVINLQALLPQIKATVLQIQGLTALQGQQAEQARMQTGLTSEQWAEMQQKVRENLPALQRALGDLEIRARQYDMPRRFQESGAHGSAAGAIGAFLRAINPLHHYLNQAR